jgi:hypothetical protein
MALRYQVVEELLICDILRREPGDPKADAAHEREAIGAITLVFCVVLSHGTPSS